MVRLKASKLLAQGSSSCIELLTIGNDLAMLQLLLSSGLRQQRAFLSYPNPVQERIN